MERATLPSSAAPDVVFRDGLGERRHVADATGHETLEVLALRAELAAVPSFEFALRERVSRLGNFRNPAFARVRAVERLSDRDATLAIISERTVGLRVSDMLREAEKRQVPLDINAALCLVRQLVPAIVALHETARDVAHGALGVDRLIITPHKRLVVTEHVVGAALEQLRFSRERYWTDLRIAVPRTAGLSRFDHRVDVTQIGLIALSLILGRLLTDEEYPAKVGDLVASAWAVSAKGGFEPLPPGLRAWLTRALQLDARSAFATAAEAHDELEKVLGDSEYLASPASLEQFLARYEGAASDERPSVTGAVPAPPLSVSAAEDVFAPEPVVRAVPEPAFASRVVFDPPPAPIARVEPEPVLAPVRPSAPASVVTPEVPTAKATTPEPTPARAAIDFDSFPQEKEEKREWTARTTSWTADGDRDPGEFGEKESTGTSRSRIVGAIAAALVLLTATGVFARRYFAAPPPAVVTTGTLVINSSPEGAAVIVDGEARGKTPITLALSAGAHKVELLADGASRVLPVTVAAGSETSQYIELPRVASDKGQLQIRTEPSGAQVTIDGQAKGVSPLTIGDLAPGEHTVLVTGPLGSVRQKVTIDAGATASLFMPLAAPEGAPVSGWLTVEAPVEMQIFEGGQLVGTSKSDRIMVSAGRHEVEVVSDLLGYRATRTVQVVAGKVAPIKLDLPKGTLALNAVPWAEVWIDGEKQGETPLGNLPVSIGPHDVVFRHPELGEQHHTALVTLKGPARLSVDLRQK